MTDENLTLTMTLDRAPDDVYDAVVDVRSWWDGEIEGTTDSVGAEFTYRNDPHHTSRQRITELVPGRRVAWHVLDAHLSFVPEGGEWRGTDIVFEISHEGDGSVLRFTHEGLVPGLQCFESCSAGWGHYVGERLRERILGRVAERQ